jgi:hypothetical protein
MVVRATILLTVNDESFEVDHCPVNYLNIGRSYERQYKSRIVLI